MTDPIADMLARIRNATLARHARVEMPSSRLKVEIAKILQNEGYIQGFSVLEPQAGERVTAGITPSLTTPIYETTTFVFESAQEVRDYNEGRSDKYLYTRYGNPTVEAVERTLAGLDGSSFSQASNAGTMFIRLADWSERMLSRVSSTSTAVGRSSGTLESWNTHLKSASRCKVVDHRLVQKLRIPAPHREAQAVSAR